MKKLLLLSLVFMALVSTKTYAQPDPASAQKEAQAKMLKEAKEKQVPMLVEKAGLTVAQAERIIEINFEIREQAATVLSGLGDAERSAKLAELKVAKEKKYSEIPLTAEQIKAVYAAYEDMGKNMPKRN